MLERYRWSPRYNRQASLDIFIDLKGGHASRTEIQGKCDSKSMAYDGMNKQVRVSPNLPKLPLSKSEIKEKVRQVFTEDPKHPPTLKRMQVSGIS